MSNRDRLKFAWDLYIIILAIYNAVFLPMQIAFAEVEQFVTQSESLTLLETFVDIFFAFDIFIAFFTSYIDTVNGEMIRQPKLIAKHYMTSGFMPDLISTTPLFLKPLVLANTEPDTDIQKTLLSFVKVFRLLKLLRVRRLSRLITNLQQSVDFKSQMSRIYVVFLLVLICHIQGCLLFWVTAEEQTWVPPTDFGSLATDAFQKDRGFWFHYFKMFYHSTLVYSMVDISFRNFSELVVLSFLILVSAIINATIFGSFSVLTEQLKRDTNDFMDKLSLVNSVMVAEKLPAEIKSSVRNHILTTHSLKNLQAEFQQFNESISSRMQTLVRMQIFSRAYRNCILSRFMKTNLYQMELEDHQINRILTENGQDPHEVVPAETRFNKVIS